MKDRNHSNQCCGSKSVVFGCGSWYSRPFGPRSGHKNGSGSETFHTASTFLKAKLAKYCPKIRNYPIFVKVVKTSIFSSLNKEHCYSVIFSALNFSVTNYDIIVYVQKKHSWEQQKLSPLNILLSINGPLLS